MKSMKMLLASSLLFATFATLPMMEGENNFRESTITAEKNSAFEKRIETLENQLKNMKPTSSSVRTAMGSAMRTTKIAVVAFGLGVCASKITEKSEGFTKFPHFSTEDIQNHGTKILSSISSKIETYRNAMGFDKANPTTNHRDDSRIITHDEIASIITQITPTANANENMAYPTTEEIINQGGGDNDRRD